MDGDLVIDTDAVMNKENEADILMRSSCGGGLEVRGHLLI